MKRHLLFCFVAGVLIADVSAQDGATLFKQNCSACHQIGRGRLVGPDLMNVHERRDSLWIANFIRSSQTVVKSGDEVAVQLFNDFNKIVMPDNNHLSDDDIKAIIAYIKAGGGEAPSVASPAASRPPQRENAPVAKREITQEELEAATRRETQEERSERLTTMFYKHVTLTLFGLSIMFCLLILLILKYKTGNRKIRKREMI